MGMKARIIGVYPNYIPIGEDHGPNYEHQKKVMGTFEVELTVVGGDLTYEQACDYLRDKTDFELTPIEE